MHLLEWLLLIRQEITSVGDDVEKLHKLVQILRETVQMFLEQLRIEIPYDPASPFPGICPKDSKAFIHEGTCTFVFIAALFTVAKTWEQRLMDD